jgi:hypothetical protein
LNKHYYGSRSCKCQPKDDLGIKYLSSSKNKDFIKDQKEHPEHYRYKIIRICKSRKDALELEIFLHEKFNVDINESFYNKAKQTSTKFYYINELKGKNHYNYGRVHSEKTRKKMSDIHKGENCFWYGKHHSEETRTKISDAKKGENHPNYGKKHSEETKRKIGDANKIANTGKKHSKETKKKMSDAQKGEKNYQFKGYYVTPFGTFASTYEQNILHNIILIKWCKNNNTIISKFIFNPSKYLRENFDKSIIGKTFADIGFSFEPKI